MLLKDRHFAWNFFYVRTSKIGIVRETMNPQILESKEGNLQMAELIDPALVASIDNTREIGMNLINNGRNSMINNFRSIKWLYHELEEVKERVGQLENQGKKLDHGNLADQGDGLRLVEKRIHNLENYNHNLANQMISILTSINDYIYSLSEKMKDRGFLQDNEENDRVRDRMDEVMTTDITSSNLDQKKMKHMAKETQKCL